jgi:ATP-dependent helicase/nuclease subunit B
MPATFILGRAGTGKTRRCLDALLAELKKPNESRKLILIVPEQASLQMERALALRAPRHGYWRAEVLSFSRLAHRVFAEAGCPPDALKPAARAMALRRVVANVEGASEAFGAAARTAGFFAQLDGLIGELLAENITPDELAETANTVGDAAARQRVTALAAVYGSYLDWLGPERIDPAQQLAALRERLAGLPWLGDASIWVDGFAGFTGQELETLVTLARGARDISITLLLDPAAPAARDGQQPPDQLNLFCPTETTYQRLLARLRDEGIEVRPAVVLQPTATPRFAQAGVLAYLEAGLATPSVAARHGGSRLAAPKPPVRVREFATHRDELRAAARFIRREVIESKAGLRFRDFAVIARDVGPFAECVAEVFGEYGIPHFLDRRRPLGAHVLVRFVQALLDAVSSDFSTRAAARLLRCGLLPVSREQAESLENLVIANEVRGFDAWRQRRWAFDVDPVSRGRDGQAADTRRESRQAAGAALNTARLRVAAALEPLVQLTRSDTTPAAATWVTAFYQALVALDVPAQIGTWIEQERRRQDFEAAEVHRLAWDALCEVLEDLHDTFGERPLELTELAATLDAALGEVTIGLAPPTLDQVLVSSIERSRHPDIKYAWVFAFNEGVFPKQPAEDALLSTTDREMLAQAGLAAPRPHRDDAFAERLLSYIALTRPSRGLTISYATVGEDGEPCFPSPLLDEVRRVLPVLAIERTAEDEPPICLREFARDYLRVRMRERADGAVAARLEALRKTLEQSATAREELGRLLRGRHYRNAPAAVGNYRRPARAGAGVAWDGSPTELENYLQCPFKHFALYGLSLSAQRGPGPEARELGSLAHEVLADVARRAMAAAENVRALSDEHWLGFCDEALAGLAQRQPADLPERRPRAAFLAEALRPFLREVVLVHAERWRRGLWQPLGCELRFQREGGEGLLNALELQTAAGQLIRLHGFIDRVDRCAHAGQTYLLVYDYKPTRRSVKRDYLTQDPLQLFTYLLAVRQAFARDENTHAAGVFVAPLYPDTGVIDTKYFTGASEAEARMYLYRPAGLFDEEVAPLLDHALGPAPSPVAAMRLKKDGGLYQSSDARPRTDIEARLELARQTVLLAAEGIVAGCVDVAPLLERKTLACQRCDFQPVCRFELMFNRPRVAEESLPVLGLGETPTAGDEPWT